MGHFYKLFIKKGLFCNYFWGSIFLLQSAPQTGVSTVHVTRGTAGNTPDAVTFGSVQGSGTTGGTPAAGATASAGQPSACPPASSSHTPSLFPHPPSQNFIFFILFIKNLNFVSSFLLVLFVIFLYSHTLHPKISIRLFFIHSKLYIF